MHQPIQHIAKRIIIAGGGTGGHIFPAIAIANALKERDSLVDILFIGAKGKMEMEKVPQAGYNIEGISISGYKRGFFLKNILLACQLLNSFIQVRKIFQSFSPDAVIGVGGYSTFPVIKYAQLLKIPSFLHESNMLAGKSNVLLGAKATKIFVSNTGMERFFPSKNLVVSGNPIRASILNSRKSKSQALSYFGLKEGYKTVLVVGGSLGAKSINEAILSKIELFEKNQLQLIWQTGKTDAPKYNEIAKKYPNIWINSFITEMEMGYAAADIVVSRAGAMALTELAVLGKVSIFVPYPLAAEDHQTVNAMSLVSNNAAIMVKDNLAKEELVEIILELTADDDIQKTLSINIRKNAIENADAIIADTILKTINN